EPAAEMETPAVPQNSRVQLRIGPALAATIALHPFQQRLEGLRNELHDDLGIEFPPPVAHPDPAAKPGAFRIEVEGIPLEEGELLLDQVLLVDDPLHLELLDIQSVEASSPLSRGPALWIDGARQAQLDEAGIDYLRPEEVLKSL